LSAALTLNPATHEVRLHGRAVEVSAREYALLEALTERAGGVVSRAQLEEKLYGWNESVGSNAVEVHIHNLRRKLGEDIIRNVRGLGYRLAAK
jgi:two-component system response regulator QseB